jgi:molecular chaperone DnaJ
MSQKQDYYEILGLIKTCSFEEIKKAYRQAALKYHPDRNPDDKAAEDQFKKSSEAYEVLSDPQKREVYDRFGHAGLTGTDFHPFNRVEDIFDSFGDLFEDFFGLGGFGGRGSRGQGRRARRGQDLGYELSVEFLEAYQGCEKEIQVRKSIACEECGGKGHPATSRPTPCPQCQGRGQVFHSQGFFTISSTCPHCQGQGEIIKVLCGKCKGHGSIQAEKKLKVKIPPGVETGNRLILKGEGEAGSEGGPSGDFYVILNVRPHELFQREGLDVWMALPVSIVQATLGASVTVPPLEGEEPIEIPSGIESGETVTIERKGFPEIRGNHRGNQVVQIVLKTPKSLTPRQEELLREFAREGGEEPAAAPTKPGEKSKSKKKRKFPWN